MPITADWPLSSEDVFRSFWLLCVKVADLAHARNAAQPSELQCAWRRHSLVITCQGRRYREIGVQRRKNLVFCTVSPERLTLWQARLVPDTSGHPYLSTPDGLIEVEAGSAALFQRITNYLAQRETELVRAVRA